MNRDEIGSKGVNKVWAVVPNASDKRIGFVRSFGDLDNGIVSVNKGINNKMEGDDSEVGIEYPPLEVMLTPNLEMRRLLIVNGDNWPVITGVYQLSVWGD